MIKNKKLHKNHNITDEYSGTYELKANFELNKTEPNPIYSSDFVTAYPT
jgi:hypothetical protein